MAEIFKTTLTPTKLELVAEWLPKQPWYAGSGSGPNLAKAGGYRLDDPAGDVGIEFMVVADQQSPEVVAYQVALSYRGSPLAGAEDALVGTMEHGVLGTRWVYDGSRDPVVLAELFRLIKGEAPPQAQSESYTPDPTVIARWNYPFDLTLVDLDPGALEAVAGDDGEPAVVLSAKSSGGSSLRTVSLRIVRRLIADDTPSSDGAVTGIGYVSGVWAAPDGEQFRGSLAVLSEID